MNSFLLAKDFDAIGGDYYEYRQSRDGSITNSISMRNFNDLGRFVSESVERLTADRKATDAVNRYAMSFVAYEYSIMMWQYSQLDKANRKEAKRFLKTYRWVLNYGTTKKAVAIRLLVKVLGIGAVSRLLACYMSWRQKRRKA